MEFDNSTIPPPNFTSLTASKKTNGYVLLKLAQWNWASTQEYVALERGTFKGFGPLIPENLGAQFSAFYDGHDDVLTGTIHKRKTSQDLLQAWERLRCCYLNNERIYIDNLSSHWKNTGPIRQRQSG